MHEMALVESVLQILEEQAIEQDFKLVKTVWLEVGALSHVEPEALKFCFDAVVCDSLADGAKLEILRTPGKAWCYYCDDFVEVSSALDACATCGKYEMRMTGGDEMRVHKLEVE